jgi:hypothetical protein
MLPVELYETSCKSCSLPVDRKYQKRCQWLLLLVCSTLDIVENFEIEFEQIDVEGEYMSILIADLLGNTISVCITYQ